MPADIEVSEQCSHCAAGAEVTGRCDCPCEKKQGGAELPKKWTLHMAICAECEGNRTLMVEEIRAAVARADPFDVAGRAEAFIVARRTLEEAAQDFAAGQKFAAAVQLANAAVDFARAKKSAPAEAAGH